jgi:hypothetical protein
MSFIGWEQAYNTTLSSPETSITISSLTSDTNTEYILEARIVNGYAGSISVKLRPNNDTGSSYGGQYLDGTNTTVSAGRYTATSITIGGANNGEVCQLQTTIEAKSGYQRTFLTRTMNVSGTTFGSMTIYGDTWTNTANELTSLVIYATQTNGLGTGTEITLWKRTDISISDSFNATAFSLTGTVQSPIPQWSSSVTATAFNLELTLHVDLDAIVTGDTLILTLHDPTVTTSSNIYPVVQSLLASLENPTTTFDFAQNVTVQSIAATLNGVTTGIITGILTRTYSFGVAEQVTATKLHNLIETSLFTISDQSAGDMFYYNGTYWQRIPKGTAGQVLTWIASAPSWVDVPSFTTLTYDEGTVEYDDGATSYEGGV